MDCDKAHAMEITGTVSLAEQFPGSVPPEPDQDAFIKDNCTRLTNDYMGNPDGFRATTLTLSYNTITGPIPSPPPSAVSRRSARNSARWPSTVTWAIGTTRTADSPWACCGPARRAGPRPGNAGCCVGCNYPAPTISNSCSGARSPSKISPRSGPPAPAWASIRPPICPPSSRWIATRLMPWRSPER
ncbi:putative conserved membrane protein [Mycobacteroides abscessus subsp. abscessus]|nr:putative conserved membrane protein [Mycobacteroides abscessus subsp. abscessus]